MAARRRYKIHPAIGIARLGDAPTFFIGPETPGLPPTGQPPGTTVPPYKDGGRIKPQAARFRVFEYVEKGGRYEVSREVSMADAGVTITWSVHLANRKASFFEFDGMAGEDRSPAPRRNAGHPPRTLDIDPGRREITGRGARPVHFTSRGLGSERWPSPAPVPPIDTLGRLLTDAEGRLLVLGGRGVSTSRPGASPVDDYSNNDGWFDDVSDGPVTAVLTIKGVRFPVTPAWVICAPPDFAPALTGVVTLYDLLYDMAARHLTLPSDEAVYRTGALQPLAAVNAEFKRAGRPVLSRYEPDFTTEIHPLLSRATATGFLLKSAVGKHQTLDDWAELTDPSPAHAAARAAILGWLRPPDARATDTWPYMPKLLGDEPYPLAAGVHHQHIRLTVTPTQYALMSRWADGHFTRPTGTFPPGRPAPSITPEGLDRAALESCAGGAFFPGIEVGWQIRHPSLYEAPFRIRHGAPTTYRGDRGAIRAGHFTRQLALPWQADFLRCKTESSVANSPFPPSMLWGWWPAQRPEWVFDFGVRPPAQVPWHRATRSRIEVPWPVGFSGEPSTPSYEEMLANWWKFGFVVEVRGGLFGESDRAPDVP